jgi:hypothetical protein
MRPSLLNPLFAAVKTLPGVGPKVERTVENIDRNPSRLIFGGSNAAAAEEKAKR